MKKLYILILISFPSFLFALERALPSKALDQKAHLRSSPQQKLEELVKRLKAPSIHELIKNFNPELPPVKRKGFANLSERIQEIEKLNNQYKQQKNKAISLYKLADEYQDYFDGYVDLIGKAKENLGKEASNEQLASYFLKNFNLDYHSVTIFMDEASKLIFPLEKLEQNFAEQSKSLQSDWIDYPHSGVHPNLPVEEFIKYPGLEEGSDHCRINRLEKKNGEFLKISVTLGKNTESILIPIKQFKFVTPPIKSFISDENSLYEIRFFDNDPAYSMGSFYLDPNGQLDSIKLNKQNNSGVGLALFDFFNLWKGQKQRVFSSNEEIKCKINKDIVASHEEIDSTSLTRNSKTDIDKKNDQNSIGNSKDKKK